MVKQLRSSGLRARDAARFENGGERRGGNAFAKGGDNATGDKDVFGTHTPPEMLFADWWFGNKA